MIQYKLTLEKPAASKNGQVKNISHMAIQIRNQQTTGEKQIHII